MITPGFSLLNFAKTSATTLLSAVCVIPIRSFVRYLPASAIDAFSLSYIARILLAVSYTHLDVYKRQELLAPAGNLEKLRTAIDYGADAVYTGGEAYSLRTACENFSLDDLAKGVDYAKSYGKAVYLACNCFMRNRDLAEFPDFIAAAAQTGIDACILDVYKRQARARALLDHFKTLSAIREASVEEIAKVKGFSPALSKKVYDFIQEQL